MIFEGCNRWLRAGAGAAVLQQELTVSQEDEWHCVQGEPSPGHGQHLCLLGQGLEGAAALILCHQTYSRRRSGQSVCRKRSSSFLEAHSAPFPHSRVNSTLNNNKQHKPKYLVEKCRSSTGWTGRASFKGRVNEQKSIAGCCLGWMRVPCVNSYHGLESAPCLSVWWLL